MTIPEWAVGLFFGALIMGLLSVAALTAAARYVRKIKEREEDR